MAVSLVREETVPRIVAVSTLFALLFIAPAASAKPRRPVTFSGTCTLSGTVVQDPPMTAVPAPGHAVATATGACSGTLTDRRGREHTLDNAPARYVARATGVVGCGGGTATGAGALRIRGRRIRFGFEEVRGPGVAAIRLTGARGGSASGEAAASTSEDPAAIAQACAGAGVSSVRIDANLATTPSISG
jgi:hypothetical protein